MAYSRSDIAHTVEKPFYVITFVNFILALSSDNISDGVLNGSIAALSLILGCCVRRNRLEREEREASRVLEPDPLGTLEGGQALLHGALDPINTPSSLQNQHAYGAVEQSEEGNNHSVSESLLTISSPVEYNKLTGIPSQNSDEASMECAICLDDYKTDPVEALLCAHVFHSKCIGVWRKREESCPICRL